MLGSTNLVAINSSNNPYPTQRRGSLQPIQKYMSSKKLHTAQKYQEQEKKIREEIWNRRIKESQKLDSKVIVKQSKLHKFTLFCIFLMVFALLFLIVPNQSNIPKEPLETQKI